MNNFCQECGSSRDKNAKFCPNCGSKFQQKIKGEIEFAKEAENSQVKNQSLKKSQAPKIGGWLYLVAIGIVVSCIFNFGVGILLIKDFKDISLLGEYYINGKIDILNIRIILGFYIINVIFTLLILFLSFYSALAFFTKSKNTRFLMLLLYGFLFIYGIIFLAFDVQDYYFPSQNPIAAIIPPIVWFLYFLKSQRVQKTFILDFSKKQKWFRIGVSSIVPIIVFFVLLIKSGMYMNDLDKVKKKHITDLTGVRELFEDPNFILGEFKKRKEEIIQQEISLLMQEYSFRDKKLNTKSEVFNFIYYDNPEYSSLLQGIIYFCGLDCSPMPQDLEKSYYYLSNLSYRQKQDVAMFLAEMDLYGIGTEQSLANAIKNANYAINLDKALQATQYYYFGLGYLYGEYYNKNIDKAIDYLKKSADLGNSSSAFLSALLMATELKRGYDNQTIIHYFKKAIMLNNSVAEQFLAYYYYNNNEYDLAKQTLRQCSKINPECKTAYQKLFS